MRPRPVFLAAIVLYALLSAPSPQAATGRTLRSAGEEFDRKIMAELRATHPEAASLFEQADAARDRGDHKQAAELYRRVFEMAPAFVHALRRQGYEEVHSGVREAGILHLRKALGLEHTATNTAALAMALGTQWGPEAPAPSAQEIDEAYILASEAAALDPADPFTQLPLCQIAMRKQEFLVMDRCVTSLKQSAPEDVVTHYYDAILNAVTGRFADAERALERAHAYGLPDEDFKALSREFAKARPWTSRLLPIAALVGGVWGGLLILLLAAGWLLSLAALRAAGRPLVETNGRARGVDSLLRQVYRIVLWLCCALYYLSLPLLVAVVLAAGGGIVYALLTVGHIPLKLLALVAVVTLVTLWSILKSVLVRGVDADPGLLLDLGQNPRMRALLDDVAGRVGTRPVESVYMTPGTDVAVMERGGFIKQLTGRRQRCLLLGVGVLEGMRLRPFKAVLAHEYGHFSNRDTAGGSFALAVRRSIITMAQGLARGGAAAWYNPAWLFINGFHRVFLIISQGASRLQEVLADRWAASLYGARAFEDGLRHVIERSIRFDSHINRTLNEVTKASSALPNLYEYRPAEVGTEEDFARAVEAALQAEPSAYDSHPSPSNRFAWVRLMPTGGAAVSADDDSPAWDLFSDRSALECSLTDVVREQVSSLYNVTIPARAPSGA